MKQVASATKELSPDNTFINEGNHVQYDLKTTQLKLGENDLSLTVLCDLPCEQINKLLGAVFSTHISSSSTFVSVMMS